MMKFYQCKKCKKTVGMIQNSPCPTMCCGEPMEELVANTTDAALEKHVPEVTVKDNMVFVQVGSVAHPMLEEHFIQWIVLETAQGYQVKKLNAGDKPVAEFIVSDGDKAVAAYEYCNLHGLWMAKA